MAGKKYSTVLKFRYSEKAAKFEKDILIYLTLLINVKKIGWFFSNYLAFLEYLNFTITKINFLVQNHFINSCFLIGMLLHFRTGYLDWGKFHNRSEYTDAHKTWCAEVRSSFVGQVLGLPHPTLGYIFISTFF